MSASPNFSRYQKRQNFLIRFGLLLWFSNAILLPVLAVIFALLHPLESHAQPAAFVTPNEMGTGSLLLQTKDEGKYIEAPRLATDVDLDVNGPTARAVLTQAFENTTDKWVEALYVFPLPEDSAVYSLKMIVGNRVVVADIKEKQAARAIYEKARREGKKASLVEQQRPNIFTNTVANIGPHEKIVVQIEYQQSVRLADGRFSLRVPLVVAPRHNPQDASPITQQADLKAGWGHFKQSSSREVSNQPISTPLMVPGGDRANPVTLKVNLNAGFPLDDVKSLYHAVKIDKVNDAGRRITLDGDATADRDFVLEWSAIASNMPSVGLFREHVGKDDYMLAYVMPPAVATPQKAGREVVFVIDNSGSMGGTSIEQARASLDYALSRLEPNDRFNVIRFDNTMTKFFPDSVMATAENIASARRFVTGLEAAGGTEMLPPLQAALDDSHQANGLRQVVFLTDGEVSNEQQLLDAIAKSRGRSRIFMVGIGSAPNTYLMSRAAELARGSFTHIGSVAEVNERMRALFDKLENPAVTDVAAAFSEKNVSLSPNLLPDIYHGEPLVLAARMGKAAGTLTVSGKIGDRPWTISLPLDQASNAKGISKIWARRQIDDAEVNLTLGKITQADADKRILQLALDHHLVTRLTSLVAVDTKRLRPTNAPLTQADIPLQLPAGWDYNKLLGIDATRDAKADTRHLQAADKSRGVDDDAELEPISAPAQASVPLPQTATPGMLLILQGLLALLCGASLLFLASRRSRA
ncbi:MULTISPECIES: marine proteobacterial sortase target protein [Rhizobium]|uniref:Ca-activated chloride channel family protein n=1 Tax=Rhizobium tropici TaxID=398 RepID=A0A6P1CDR6_RHITR|nr:MULTISPECIES: marine proteobacterial sortase target protein [Rhizobium]AGB75713.1 von Willebrand factor type A domain-containing protein [Rhizobium tropici CIAT 899]MBB4244950.1 Ca-activated chloride channel family protein [Rhizobium tropici]MBB5595828.1 Ca-activated chloride channel family protein [Rhizobium tropici]MBB6495305.1 Ca-activated chloride channel family protein [Rhizobium tropici]NEV14282.1 VWA domain-containing protein [Rhizobium tropici]